MTAEPLLFPPPPDEISHERIEATADKLRETFPYRTLLDCREFAARIVDMIFSWDAMWPEAEGDCVCPDSNISHREGCPHWTLPW